MSGEKIPKSDEVQAAESGRHELAARREHGIDVVIWWVKKSNLCLMSLTDIGKNQTLEFAVEPDQVMQALQHPYIYAYQAGMEFDNRTGGQSVE